MYTELDNKMLKGVLSKKVKALPALSSANTYLIESH